MHKDKMKDLTENQIQASMKFLGQCRGLDIRTIPIEEYLALRGEVLARVRQLQVDAAIRDSMPIGEMPRSL